MVVSLEANFGSREEHRKAISKDDSSSELSMASNRTKIDVSNRLTLQILAGVNDRGGQSAVIECTTTGLLEGRCAS